jgi:hypothetical protein
LLWSKIKWVCTKDNVVRHQYIDVDELIQELIKLKRKFKRASTRYHMLEAFYLYCDYRYVKICLKRVPPIVKYWGATRKTSPRKLNEERHSS